MVDRVEHGFREVPDRPDGESGAVPVVELLLPPLRALAPGEEPGLTTEEEVRGSGLVGRRAPVGDHRDLLVGVDHDAADDAEAAGEEVVLAVVPRAGLLGGVQPLRGLAQVVADVGMEAEHVEVALLHAHGPDLRRRLLGDGDHGLDLRDRRRVVRADVGRRRGVAAVDDAGGDRGRRELREEVVVDVLREPGLEHVLCGHALVEGRPPLAEPPAQAHGVAHLVERHVVGEVVHLLFLAFERLVARDARAGELPEEREGQAVAGVALKVAFDLDDGVHVVFLHELAPVDLARHLDPELGRPPLDGRLVACEEFRVRHLGPLRVRPRG